MLIFASLSESLGREFTMLLCNIFHKKRSELITTVDSKSMEQKFHSWRNFR
jgi:hypothetical protein